MKILLVEDDEQRYNNFKNALESMTDDSCFANSQIYGETLLQTINKQPDPIDLYFELFKIIEEEGIELVFIDFFLLQNDNSHTPTGIFLANKLRTNVLHEKIPIVLHSREYNNIDAFGDHAELMVGNAHYIPTQNVTNYVKNLTKKIKEIFDQKSAQIEAEIVSYKNRTFDYNLAIITALEKEYDGLSPFVERVSVSRVSCGNIVCHTGYILNRDEGIIVKVVRHYTKNNDAFFGEYGTPATINAVNGIKVNCKSEYIVMTGVMAGYKDKVKLGDVIISKSAYNLVSPRNSNATAQLTGPAQYSNYFSRYVQELISIDKDARDNGNSILDTFVNFYLDENENEKYEIEINGKKELTSIKNIVKDASNERFNIHEAITVTRDAVLDDQNIFDDIIDINNSIAGVDMEIYGLYSSISSSDTKVIALKTVVDYGDGKKSKIWHKIGSHLSAKLMVTMFLEIIYPKKRE